MLEQGNHYHLLSLMEQNQWPEAIVKPLISGAARHTYRLKLSALDELQDIQNIFDQLIRDEGFLLQEFQPNICQQGRSIINGDRWKSHSRG